MQKSPRTSDCPGAFSVLKCSSLVLATKKTARSVEDRAVFLRLEFSQTIMGTAEPYLAVADRHTAGPGSP